MRVKKKKCWLWVYFYQYKRNYLIGSRSIYILIDMDSNKIKRFELMLVDYLLDDQLLGPNRGIY